jgi:hypothetical protein
MPIRHRDSQCLLAIVAQVIFMPHVRCPLIILGAVLLLLHPGSAADAPSPTVPDADYPGLLELSGGVIREALKGKPDKRSVDKARTAAVMIAAYAQQNLSGPNGPQRASVRDAALELAALIKAKEFDKALKQLDALATLKANPKAQLAKLKLVGKSIEFDDIMTQFRQPVRGGLGIEARFDELGAGEGGVIPAKELDDALVRQALLAAVAAELTAEYVPEDKDKLKLWQALAADMRQQSLALAAVARSKDGKQTFLAVEHLNKTCAKCHKEFR